MKSEEMQPNRFFIQSEYDKYDAIGKAACIKAIQWKHPLWPLIKEELDRGSDLDILFKKEDGKETSFEVEVRSALIAGDFDKTRQTVNTWPTYSVPLRKARSNARWFVGFNMGLTDFWIFEMILVKRSPVILKLARQPDGEYREEEFFDCPTKDGKKFHIEWNVEMPEATKDNVNNNSIRNITPCPT